MVILVQLLTRAIRAFELGRFPRICLCVGITELDETSSPPANNSPII